MTSIPRKRISVMNTSFRDGFQSVFGARVLMEDFLPAVEASREAGITHFEAGGGARFQSNIFYCNENAFDMMDAFRKAAGPDANLQTLSRGVNVVCLDSQPSDVIDLHAKMFKKHGMTTIRNFDALNDAQNLIHSGRCIHQAGLKHEVVVTVMELPPGCEGAHTAEFYIKTLRDILDADIPFSSVCFKDASGTAAPQKVYETIKQARQLLGDKMHIRFHTHDTAGISVAGYKAAIEAGADGIDLAMAPVSGGTSQPDFAVMWHALRGTQYALDFDIDKVMKAAAVFKDCMKDYFIPPEAMMVEPLIIWSPMPGGALTANTQMMRDNGILERFPEVIGAMEETVRRGGFGTSVTPVSQFYFQQAFNNVIFGPWKKFADGYGKMVLGYFGKTPVPPDPEIVKLAAAEMKLEPTTRSPLEMNDENPKKGIEATKKILAEHKIEPTDENIFIVAACGDKGVTFLKGEAKVNVRKNTPKGEEKAAEAAPAKRPDRFSVTVGAKTYAVQFENDKRVVVDGTAFDVEAKAEGAGAPAAAAAAGSNGATVVKSPLAGSAWRVKVAQGDSVKEGDVLIILESMKMEIPVPAPKTGKVAALKIKQGDPVKAGQELVHIA